MTFPFISPQHTLQRASAWTPMVRGVASCVNKTKMTLTIPFPLLHRNTPTARIDVDTNGAGWPTDLDLHVSVNRALTTFDGVPVTMAQRGNTVVCR
jgi:hypothetical protein